MRGRFGMSQGGLGLPGGSVGKEFACNAGDLGSISGLRRFLGEGKGYPLEYSGLENSVDRIVLGVAKSWTRLCFYFLYFDVTRLPSQWRTPSVP